MHSQRGSAAFGPPGGNRNNPATTNPAVTTRTRSIGRSTGAARDGVAGGPRSSVGRLRASSSSHTAAVARGGRPLGRGRAPTHPTLFGTRGRSPATMPGAGAGLSTAQDAIQAEMDALADEFYGSVPSRAPEDGTPSLRGASTRTVSADSPYYRADAGNGLTADTLRSTTSWYEGPADPAGRTFDASDSNLLCMDVLVPRAAASGAMGRTPAARTFGAAPPSASSPLCVVGSADHGLKVFDLCTMRELKTLYTKTCGHTEWVTACRFLSDRRVISGGMDSKLCLWNDVTRGGPGRCVDLLGHTGSISQVEVNECHGRFMAMSSSYDRTIRVWELDGIAGGREMGCLSGHKGPVTQFSWLETEVLSGDRQGTVKLWDVETAQCHLTASSKRGQIGSLAHLVHPDVGHLALFGDQGGALTVVDARGPSSAKPLFQDVLHRGGMVTFIRAPSPTAVSAPLIVTCGADKRIIVRDARHNFAEVCAITDHDDFVYSMEVIGNLLLSGAGNGRLLVHDVETGELLYELKANAAAVREMFASPSVLVAAGDDGNARVFDFM
ncbi:WD domain-containing protein [Leishmania donovani]|uniref:WD domain, G-beta repeat family protein n=1 Tax=Leishmania donovani TaxID=5661 RepID=A0A504X4X3_LEIDO|nr:WD domain, G-beta repeat family protein [Leishmania donovani]CAJ1990929.1 WD domain-containing protein [Leishmania donovani]VDZ46780.1 WD_domain_G-beta_repeat_putative/Pfam:PF00400 [Leishmania donovani]